MFIENGFRYFKPEEVDVGRCPSFNRKTLEPDHYAEVRLGCWNPKLKTMDVNGHERYQGCPIYSQTKEKILY